MVCTTNVRDETLRNGKRYEDKACLLSPLQSMRKLFFIKKLCMGEQTFWGKFMRLYAEYAELCRKYVVFTFLF